MNAETDAGATSSPATRPAPGPARDVRLHQRHRRSPHDPRLCVCGDLWVQAMICHPCRYPGHGADACVDGPGELVDEAGRDGAHTRRVYPDRGAGRWCCCQHEHRSGLTPVPRMAVIGRVTTQAVTAAFLRLADGFARATDAALARSSTTAAAISGGAPETSTGASTGAGDEENARAGGRAAGEAAKRDLAPHEIDPLGVVELGGGEL